ncbi:Fimbrial adapter PapK precursor [compost metagenome]
METPEGVALSFNQPTPAWNLTSGTNSFKLMAYVAAEPAAIQNQSITPGDFSATATFELAYP